MKKTMQFAFICYEEKLGRQTLRFLEDALSLGHFVCINNKLAGKFKGHVNLRFFNHSDAEQETNKDIVDCLRILATNDNKIAYFHRITSGEVALRPLTQLSEFLAKQSCNYCSLLSGSCDNKLETVFDFFGRQYNFRWWTFKKSALADLLGEDSHNCSTLDPIRERLKRHCVLGVSLSYHYALPNDNPMTFYNGLEEMISVKHHFFLRNVSENFQFHIKPQEEEVSINQIEREAALIDYEISSHFEITKTTPFTRASIAFKSHLNPIVIFLVHDSEQNILAVADRLAKIDAVMYAGRPFRQASKNAEDRLLRDAKHLPEEWPATLSEISAADWHDIKSRFLQKKIYVFSYVPYQDWVTVDQIHSCFERSCAFTLCHDDNVIQASLLSHKLSYEQAVFLQEPKQIDFDSFCEALQDTASNTKKHSFYIEP